MKSFISVSIVLAVALAVPIKDAEISGPKRDKTSASYRPPAGPYGPAPAPASELLYGPGSSTFYLRPGGHMPTALHYRENEHPWESMTFSHHEKHPQDRSYEGYGSPAGGAAQASASESAMGLFPNAHIGGCAIPLLVSCAPSISKGQIIKSQHASYSAPSYGYRHMDFNTQMRMHDAAMQKAAKQQAQWGEMEHAATATGMGHVHQPTSDVHASHSPNDLHGNHMHLLSHDAHVNLATSKMQGHHG